MMIAFDALASSTSESVIAPTPRCTTSTLTSGVDSWASASANASALFARAQDSWSWQIIWSMQLPQIPTTGVPHACASDAVWPNVSSRDGTIMTSADE